MDECTKSHNGSHCGCENGCCYCGNDNDDDIEDTPETDDDGSEENIV